MTPKDWRHIESAWTSARYARETGNPDMKQAFKTLTRATVLRVAQRLKQVANK